MAELDTFDKLLTAVLEILPNAVIEEHAGQLVIYTNLREERGEGGKLKLVQHDAGEYFEEAESAELLSFVEKFLGKEKN